MKNWIILFLVVFSMNVFSQQKTSKTPDKNLLMAISDFKKNFLIFINNKNEKLDADNAAIVMSAVFCLESFRGKGDSEVLEKALSEFQNNKEFGVRLEKLKTNEDLQKKMMKIYIMAQNNPVKLCTFVIDENTEEMIEIKKAKEIITKKYTDIINLKKTIHPVFVKLINDLEKKKDHLSRPSNGPIELIEADYEKNFDLIYQYQTKYIENKSLAVMSKLPSLCIENIKKVYLAQCNGKPRFMSIKGMVTKYLLCADDNKEKIDKACVYEVVFTAS